jgi:hypothetical protein
MSDNTEERERETAINRMESFRLNCCRVYYSSQCWYVKLEVHRTVERRSTSVDHVVYSNTMDHIDGAFLLHIRVAQLLSIF